MSKNGYTHYLVIKTEEDYEEFKKYIIYLKNLDGITGYFDAYLEFFERGYSIYGDNTFIDNDRPSIVYFRNSADRDIGWDKVRYDLERYVNGMKEYKTAREWVLDVPEARERLLKSETKLGSLL